MDGSERISSREVGYFVALAEELHFGRAAERLGIAQPPLSRAIRQLERRLGVALVERVGRTIRLTAAGEVLYRDGGSALEALDAAGRRAQRAADPRLVLAMKPGGDAGLLTAILAEYETQADAVPVEIVFDVRERAARLRDGRADVGLLHRPQNDLTGLDAEPLRTERQVALLPGRHPLARRDSVQLADLERDPTPRWAGPTRPGAANSGEIMQLIALGRLTAVVPESVRDRLGAGVVARPVLDAPTATLVVAWSARSTSVRVADFVRAATRVAQAGTLRPGFGTSPAGTPRR